MFLQLLSHPVFAPLVFECNTDADDMHFAHYWMSTISRVASENGVSFGRDAANVFKRALSQPDLRPCTNRYQVVSTPQ